MRHSGALADFLTWLMNLMNLPWTDILDASEKVVTIAAIVIGGIAAYYKFLRGRVFHPRMEIAMLSSWLIIGNQLFLKVQATVKNTGASRTFFDPENTVLRVFCANHAGRGIADETNWTNLATINGVDDKKHKWIEPAETIHLNWLVDLPTDSTYLALRSELCLAGEETLWYADTIAEREPHLSGEAIEHPHRQQSKIHDCARHQR